jgi:hypothetical protein
MAKAPTKRRPSIKTILAAAKEAGYRVQLKPDGTIVFDVAETDPVAEPAETSLKSLLK